MDSGEMVALGVQLLKLPRLVVASAKTLKQNLMRVDSCT